MHRSFCRGRRSSTGWSISAETGEDVWELCTVKSLERQLKSPYFARLDFKEKGEEGDSFYIGLASVEDKDNFDFYVFDWRSPVANMFYDFEVCG